jgi:hypothetical protein
MLTGGEVAVELADGIYQGNGIPEANQDLPLEVYFSG